MKDGPQLSILIATLGARERSFRGLVNSLHEQIRILPIGVVEVVAYWNNGERPIGRVRQDLLNEARGDYVCFIDDDDGVPDYYCSEILTALGEDYVGFQVQLFNDGRLMPPVFHSIRYGIWHQDDSGYYRGITHLNPLKRSIALKGQFGLNDGGEDAEWAHSVTPHVRTENYIKKIMYYYHHNSELSAFGGSHSLQGEYDRPEIERSFFRYHPKSKRKGTVWK